MSESNPQVMEGIDEDTPVWLTTPSEFAAKEVGRWVVIPRDPTDAMLRRGVCKQVTMEAAMAQHRTHMETALELNYPVATSSVEFHRLTLPKGYARKDGYFVYWRSKRGREGFF